MRWSSIAPVLHNGHRLSNVDRITESALSFPPTLNPTRPERAGGAPDHHAPGGQAVAQAVDAPDASRSAIETGNRRSPSRLFVQQALGPA